jgi:hypothetical protein
MTEREKLLKEKLGLTESDELKYTQFERTTRNANFIISVNGNDTYFMKANSEGREKELAMYSFLKDFPVVKTIPPIYADDTLFVFPFIRTLRDGNVVDEKDFILDFQNASLALSPQDFVPYLRRDLFKNDYIGRFLSRIKRHEKLVKNFWEDVESLEKFYIRTFERDFNQHPKILVHGDIQHKNIQKTPEGTTYLIDFEDSYFDSPSWELSRILMDLEGHQIPSYVADYLSKLNLDNKETLKREAMRSFVIRVITDSIGRQQRFPEEKAKEYLDLYKLRYTSLLEEIIYG